LVEEGTTVSDHSPPSALQDFVEEREPLKTHWGVVQCQDNSVVCGVHDSH
jgi:hypothetical protein